MEMKPATFQINPIAMLAAVLYNIDKTMSAKIKADDEEKPRNVSVDVVDIQQEGNSLMCAIPMKALMHFVNVPYEMTFNIAQPHNDLNPENAIALFGFQKSIEKTKILQANGQAALPSKSFEKLLKKVAGDE